MKTKLLTQLSTIVLLIVLSCNSKKLPRDFEEVLSNAKGNRAELLKIVEHYSQNKADSLKLKATYFLLNSLQGRHYVNGVQLDNYMNYPMLILRDLEHGEYIMKTFNERYGVFNLKNLTTKNDLEEITANQFISNMDAAFNAWQKPWSRDNSFDQFCKYILPFRINNEKPSYNRKEIYERFEHILDSVPNAKKDAISACIAINNVLVKEGWILSNRSSFLPNYHSSTLIDYRIGVCRDMTDLGIYVMRAMGIPVASDLTPQWANRSQGHEWNVVFDVKGKAHPFLAAEDSPGQPHKPNSKPGKVYRINMTTNYSSLAKLAGPKDVIPDFFKNNHLIDVTDEYTSTANIVVDLGNTVGKNRFAYLTAFNNEEWRPLCWSRIAKQQAVFSKVEKNIVVMASYFDASGVIPVKLPFIIDDDGNQRMLKADTLHKIKDLTCDRIYPIMPEHYFTDIAKGGRFQMANKIDFSDAVDVFEFKMKALPGWNRHQIKNRRMYRYIRFISAKESQCKIAELQFYSDGKVIKGKIFGSAPKDEIKNMDFVADGNPLTDYISSTNAGWVGFDFGKTVSIDQIGFMAKIFLAPQHLIEPGKTYKLNYWDQNGWKVFQTQVATGTTVIFRNIPSNALFLLTSDVELKDKRIFTCEKNRQVWW